MLDGVVMEEVDQHAGEPPVAAGEVLQQRVVDSVAARDEALQQLREIMSDEEILAEFGIDVGRLT